MSLRHRLHRRAPGSRRRSFGQAMIEYVVVLAFGVVILIQDTPTEPSVMKQLADAIRDYHKHYSYAMSLAYIPECDYAFAFDKSVNLNDVTTAIASTGSVGITGGVSGTIDRCLDWQDPSIPLPTDIDFHLDFAGLTSSVETMITSTIKGYLTGYLEDMLNPTSLLSDLFNFKISDFF